MIIFGKKYVTLIYFLIFFVEAIIYMYLTHTYIYTVIFYKRPAVKNLSGRTGILKKIGV